MTAEREKIRLLALVGTDHHPFDRLVNLLDELVQQHDRSLRELSCLVQYGTANPPALAPGVQFLAKDSVQSEIHRADLVLCHGGPSTIVEILRSGKKPLVMPRDPNLGEHVDGHQQRFSQHMARQGLIELVESVHEVHARVEQVMDGAASHWMAQIDLPSPEISARNLGQIVESLLAPASTGPRRGLFGKRNPSRHDVERGRHG